MSSSVSQQLQQAAQQLFLAIKDPKSNVARALNGALNQFLPSPRRVVAARVIGSEGVTTQVFESVICTSVPDDPVEPLDVKAHEVAGVIYSVHSLSAEELSSAYDQIGAVKRIKKIPVTKPSSSTDTPLGIIFAVEATEPVEKIAQRMMVLNASHPSSEWPDLVVILTRGTINYAVQFEGDPIGGDFLLPNEPGGVVYPMYAHVFLRSLGLHSFNRMCALIFMQLQIFAPGPKLPLMEEALEGISQYGMTLGGYQFNLSHALVPVPDEMYRDRGVGLRNLPFRIEDKKGRLFSHVQFIPWQSGGAIRVIGKMPIEPLLVLFGSIAKEAHTIKRSDGVISSVLPITREQFFEMLGRFQRQSNMVVKPEQPSWTISKLADEGTQSPFMARIFLGITRLRDVAFSKNEREAFEKAYQFVLTNLLSTRTATKEILAMLEEHKRKVSAGERVRLVGNMIHEDEPIDRELRRKVEEFLNGAARVIKHGMQNVALAMKQDIGFLFKKQRTFEDGVAKLATVHPELAAYLTEARKWSERLIDGARNALEHDGWVLPRTKYNRGGNGLEVVEPEILGEPVSVFVDHMMDRVYCFVEEVSAFGLRQLMPSDISITEIPLSERKIECPERFQMALAQGGMPLWKLQYHTSKFDET